MRRRQWRWVIAAALLTGQLSGCAGVEKRLEQTKEDLEKHGIEMHSGQVVRVFRF